MKLLAFFYNYFIFMMILVIMLILTKEFSNKTFTEIEFLGLIIVGLVTSVGKAYKDND